MIALTGRWKDWFAGLATGCDRLIHPGATGVERGRRKRLFGLLLAGPFIMAAAIAQAVWPFWGAAGVLAALCAIFGISWLLALLVATRGGLRQVGTLVLVGSALLTAMVAALSGGLAAPVSMLLAALPIEAWFVFQSRQAVLMALMAAIVAAVAAIAGSVLFLSGEQIALISAWQWLSPLFYGATLGLRFMLQEDGAEIMKNEGAVMPEACLDAVVARLGRAGETEAVSSQAAAILGVEPELLLGGGLFERIHVGDRVAFLCAAAKARDEGVPQRCETRIRMPAAENGGPGPYRPFDIELVQVEAGCVAAIIREGQEKAELRDALALAREQASSGEITKGRFLATVSHELRTPLNAIIGFSDMLLHREISGDLAPKQAEQVGLIRDAGNHLLSVVNAILDVSKIEAGSYHIVTEAFDLEPAMELCCAMLEPQASERGVTLGLNLPSDLGQLMGDRRALQQILINLLSNAIKFTPAGGQVTVTAARSGTLMHIFVNDTGIGIENEDLLRLGQPFVQVQNDYTRQFQGTGLGLSLVKGLVKLHGGSMSIESAPGLGTKVTVGLPAATQEECVRSAPAAEMESGEQYDVALRKIA